MSLGARVIELAMERSWKQIKEVEEQLNAFRLWLASASEQDLYLLIRQARRGKKPSNQRVEIDHKMVSAEELAEYANAVADVVKPLSRAERRVVLKVALDNEGSYPPPR